MYPTIPARRHRLEIARLPRFVSQCAADLRDDAGQGVIGDGGSRPDAIEDLLFGEEMAGTLNHEGEQVECLRFERDWGPGPFKAPGVQVEHEVVPAESC